MKIRNESGFAAVEGCLFAAVGLFVILLIAVLVILFLRYHGNTPPSETGGPTVMRGIHAVRVLSVPWRV
ncbi:MAG TPA: hypothetical protein VFL93_11580 [Longimicrobiaceae bacterium]|nr:hypothetical protein [Longimicrobiaceae bacterium]